ncbi:MAG: hypothetical protein GY847_18485 [Proteobacteria bacterium]|nr:hypothetical protein [Pseudomonadota bacterium]
MRQKRHIAALSVLAFFLAWQTGSVLHLLFTPHAVCEHGKIVDSDAESGEPKSDSHDEEDADHENCLFLTFMTSARTMVSDYESFEVVADVLENEISVPLSKVAVLCGEELFYLSPSNSPPAIS